MLNGMRDTIVALATGNVSSAIAMVRLSGSQSIAIAQQIFRKREQLENAPERTLVHGYICAGDDSRNFLDEVMVCKYFAPRSYSGEDMVEISCHGGRLIVQQIIAEICLHGARVADPGEFSLRAVMNGKLDLVQAEAVADMINAQSTESLVLATQQLTGRLSRELSAFSERLTKQCALLELELDFSEDVHLTDRGSLTRELDVLLEKSAALIATFEYGRTVRAGVGLVIVGRPNVGKSSLLNRLLQEERALVSPIPGTTRDSLEESVTLGGIVFRITDTAGLREHTDYLEELGIARTKKIMADADVILIMLDNAMPLQSEDLAILEYCSRPTRAKTLLVLNKCDLAPQLNQAEIQGNLERGPVVQISSLTGQGLDLLSAKLAGLAAGDKPTESDVILSNVRHKDALIRTEAYLGAAKKSLQQELSAEFVAQDLRAALACLGEITGAVTSRDILNHIFSSFCIGK